MKPAPGTSPAPGMNAGLGRGSGPSPAAVTSPPTGPIAAWRATDGTAPAVETTTPVALDTAGSAPPLILAPDATVAPFAGATNGIVRSAPLAAAASRRSRRLGRGSVAVAGLVLPATADAAPGWVGALALFVPTRDAGAVPDAEGTDAPVPAPVAGDPAPALAGGPPRCRVGTEGESVGGEAAPAGAPTAAD